MESTPRGEGGVFHIIFVAPDRALPIEKPRASFGSKSFSGGA